MRISTFPGWAFLRLALFVSVLLILAVGTMHARENINFTNEIRSCPESLLNNDSASAQAPQGAAISDIDSENVFGCQHFDEARKAGPLEQLRNVDLRSGECTRFARGENVYTVQKAWSSAQADPDGRRVSPSLYAVQRVGGGPIYYVVREIGSD